VVSILCGLLTICSILAFTIYQPIRESNGVLELNGFKKYEYTISQKGSANQKSSINKYILSYYIAEKFSKIYITTETTECQASDQDCKNTIDLLTIDFKGNILKEIYSYSFEGNYAYRTTMTLLDGNLIFYKLKSGSLIKGDLLDGAFKVNQDTDTLEKLSDSVITFRPPQGGNPGFKNLLSSEEEFTDSRSGYKVNYQKLKGNAYDDFMNNWFMIGGEPYISKYTITKDNRSVKYQISNTTFANGIDNNFATKDGVIVIMLRNSIWILQPE
jgi:hypothetical protein